MNTPTELKYTKDHEWLKVAGDEVIIGITDYAQGELGDIVYLELPEIGIETIRGEAFGTIEAVKAAADLNAPVAGEVTAVNDMLVQSPELINQSPYDKGWIIRLKLSDPSVVDTLLSAKEYIKHVEAA